MRRSILRTVFSLSACAASATLAAAQSPTADARGLLEAVTAIRGGKSILFTGAVGAFFPADSQYDGSAKFRENFRCHLVLDEGGKEVGRWSLLVNPAERVFQRFQTFGAPASYALTGNGKYVMSVEFDGKDVTSLPFEIVSKKSGDPFNPATTYAVECDLAHWAQISVSRQGSQPKVRADFRLRASDLGIGAKEKVQVTIERQGRVVYSGGEFGSEQFSSDLAWRSFRRELKYPGTQGGGFLPLADFTKVDGTYRIVLRSGGKLLHAWEYVIAGGAIQPHPRSSFDHSPHTDYLLSQVCLPEAKGFEEIYWLEPLADPNAGAGAPAAATVASAATRAAWGPAVAVPERKPAVVVTDIAARVDAHIAAGDELVAYGTGPNTGVAFIRCGEDVETSIPGGADYSSKWFEFCGKKLVLVKRNEVAIFDTESGNVTPIAADDVWLPRTPTDSMKGAHIAADGNLVAVLCSPDKVSDRRVCKVIDLSGGAPKIITLGFPDARPNELASIAVDAAGGVVVIGSDRKNCLFTAPIADDASFTSIDLSQHDGLTKDCAPIVRGGKAAIFDSTGTRKLRIVDLESGAVKSLCGLGKSLRFFDFDGERVALASDVSYGSSYEIRIGAADGRPEAPAGAGESSSYGKAGYAQRVALTPVGLVFASGYGKGGISKDEVLLVGDGSAWHEVVRGDGPLPAVDATSGASVVAFKTGKSRDARIGYVQLGRGMNGTGLGVDG